MSTGKLKRRFVGRSKYFLRFVGGGQKYRELSGSLHTQCWCSVAQMLVRPREHRPGGEASSEGLVVVAVGGPVPEHLTDLTVRALLAPAAVVRGVRWVLGHLRLGGTVLCVMEIEAVTYVTEEARFLLGLFLLVVTAKVHGHD